MKVSKLIKLLQLEMETEGDLEVVIESSDSTQFGERMKVLQSVKGVWTGSMRRDEKSYDTHDDKKPVIRLTSKEN
ncbi:MAG: hypothetical protein PUF37_00805 [Prevotellaceae bacterium]|nr:hypothetical protein [Prevotellaceae bacterium]